MNLPPTASGGDAPTREKAKDAQTYDVEDSESEPEAPDRATKAESPKVAYLEQMFSKRLDAMQSMVEMLPGVAPPIRKRNPDSYADTPFTDAITLIEMPRKESREATLCKGFSSTLTGPALKWYINLPSRSTASFVILRDKFVEQFASSRDLEKTSYGLYEIRQHRMEPLRGYIARFNQEKVAIPNAASPLLSLPSREACSPTGTSIRS